MSQASPPPVIPDLPQEHLDDIFSLVGRIIASPSNASLSEIETLSQAIGIDFSLLRALFAFALEYIRSAHNKSLSSSKVHEDLSKFKLPPSFVTQFLQCYDSCRLHLLTKSSSIESLSSLVDVDWRFGVNVACKGDFCSGAFVDLSLKLLNSDGTISISVIQLTVAELFVFLSKMERLKSNLDSYY
ncbi:hypothetical protein RCL1_003225 [Eukaryota sp. TZLM3-RCL]